MVTVKSHKEPNIINIPDDIDGTYHDSNEPLSIYELLMKNDGNFQKVSKILDDKITETNQLIQDLSTHINDLPSEEFEVKLAQLKRENHETRFLCEEFQKIADRKSQNQGQIEIDAKNRLFSKPPIIPRNTKPNIAILSKPNMHDLNQYGNRSSTSFYDSSYEDYDETEEAILQRERQYQRNSAMSRLYKRPHSADSQRDTSQNYSPGDKWRHHITVPEPFEMTKRAENQRKLHETKLTRTLTDFQLEKAEKERQEEEELKKQFRANPVPAHVYIPMYQSMQEEASYRRQVIREYSKEILKSMEKPFNFYKRDEHKRQLQQSVADYKNDEVNRNKKTNYNTANSIKGEREKTVIRAKPIPKTSKENMNMERLKEEDIYRKIKAELRAKELLEESKMPGEMEERHRLQKEKNRRKLLENYQNGKKLHTLFPSSSSSGTLMSGSFKSVRKSVPDFSKIHKDWEEEVRMSSKEPIFTQPKPFKLMSEERAKSKSVTKMSTAESKSENGTNRQYNPRIKEWSKSIMSSLEMPRPSTTKSEMLKEKSLIKKKQKEKLKEYEKQLTKFSKMKKEHEIGYKLRQSIDTTMDPKEIQRRKLMKLKMEDEERQNAYRNEIDRLKDKVYQKPLLFERTYKSTPIGTNNNAASTYSYDQQHNRSRSMNNSHSNSRQRGPGHRENSGSMQYSQKFEPYNTKNHFGDHVSYKSTTEASSINSNSNFNNSHTLVNDEMPVEYVTSLHTEPMLHGADQYEDDFEPDVKVTGCGGEELLIEEYN